MKLLKCVGYTRCDWLLDERLGFDNLVYPSSVDRLMG